MVIIIRISLIQNSTNTKGTTTTTTTTNNNNNNDTTQEKRPVICVSTESFENTATGVPD